MHSRIGEPLQAEVAIIARADEKLEAVCFSLSRIKDADLPVITNARLQLEQGSQGMRLRITAPEPLHEPLATLRLRAGCGVELQRDYFVMPSPPDTRQTESRIASAPVRTSASAVASEPLRPRSAPPAKKPRPAPRPPPEARGDRLVLGNSPMQLDYNLPSAISEETEARLLRMETSLSRLNESLQKLEAAMVIGSEIKAAEQELQLAIALRQPPAAGPLPEEKLPANTAWKQWLELLGGALFGGVLSALALQYLSRLRPDYRDR
ncbi:hypothetical protein [Azonexus hydrophilus]|uniref:Uncharacterized protein n=1 Tax=Azonexus hydrophilus TaxID=418702 RepID=A0ABZ2XF54_9RHOO